MRRQIAILGFMMLHCTTTAVSQHAWTILYYAGGCNSSEETLLQDLREIQSSVCDNAGYRIIMLIDRVEGFSSDAITFNEDFTDTRLYEITSKGFRRINGAGYLPEITTTSGYDANMGDAHTLKNFIRFGKHYYPANQYALFVYSHGDGISFSADIESDRDALYPAEITDVLSESESVSLMAMDVCSMAVIEVAYQWRPAKGKFSVDYLVASAPVSAPWDYTTIISRLSNKENGVDAMDLSALDFGKLLIEEIRKNQPWCSWGLFDLGKVEAAKEAIDAFIQRVPTEKLTISLSEVRPKTIDYLPTFDPQNMPYYKMRIPYFDVYDLFTQLKMQMNEQYHPMLDQARNAIDEMVVTSFYATGGNFLKRTQHFTDGKNGLSIFFSFGSEEYPYTKQTHWAEQQFYSPHKVSLTDGYGNLAWCYDGATPANKKAENWFELLDAMYDDGGIAKGNGPNGYQY